MTALKRYARLECPGVWRPDPEAQGLEVVVAFGDASLVITDKAGRPLSHWSLSATVRVRYGGSSGAVGAIYTPSAEAIETLELNDDIMIDAIETVRRAVDRARPRSGRVRALALATAVVASIGGAVWWVPEALVSHAVAVLPDPTRAELGTGIVAALARVSAAPCSSPRADRALADLAAVLTPLSANSSEEAQLATRARQVYWADGGTAKSVVVIPDGINGAHPLPGGVVLVGRALVEDFETPEVLAGHLLESQVRAQETAPLSDLLRVAGPLATAQLLTTGKLPQEAVQRYAETLLTDAPEPVDQDRLIESFAEAGLSTAPYAYARDVTGETVLGLIEADPARGQSPHQIMTDRAWAAVQAVCESG